LQPGPLFVYLMFSLDAVTGDKRRLLRMFLKAWK